MPGALSSLGVRNYRLFAIGGLISNIGTWMQRVAQDWLILVLTGSAQSLGLTVALQFLPMLLLSPMAGVAADRYSKRVVIGASHVLMGVAAAMLGVLAVTGTVATWHVYAAALAFGVGTAFETPARHAFVNEMVPREHLANGVALNSASFNLARMLGPAMAGLLIAALGSGATATGWVILVNAATYVAVLVSLARMDPRALTPVERLVRQRGQIREAVTYVRSSPQLMLIMTIVFIVGMWGFNLQMTTALMATSEYGKGAREFGLLGSVLAIGSLLGSLLAARRSNPSQRLIVGAAFAFGVSLILAGTMPTYGTFAVILPFCGLAGLTLVTAANARMQLSTTAELRGRVMALYFMVFMGGTPLGAPILGAIAEWFGARYTLIVGGAVTSLGTMVAVAVFVPGLRHRHLGRGQPTGIGSRG